MLYGCFAVSKHYHRTRVAFIRSAALTWECVLSAQITNSTGTPYKSRTCSLRIRSPSLYPFELMEHMAIPAGLEPATHGLWTWKQDLNLHHCFRQYTSCTIPRQSVALPTELRDQKGSSLTTCSGCNLEGYIRKVTMTRRRPTPLVRMKRFELPTHCLKGNCYYRLSYMRIFGGSTRTRT